MRYAICAGTCCMAMLLSLLSVVLRAQAPSTRDKEKQDTETETLYRNHYSNCEGGYGVDLPAGVVAHRDKAGSDRGFQIDLSAPGDTRPFSASEERFISVSDHFNSLELPSFAAIVQNELAQAQDEQPDWSVLERLPIKLDGLQATHLRARFKGKKMVDEDIYAWRHEENGRGNFVYKIQLVTLQTSYSQDRGVFDQIVAGFHRLAWDAAGCQ